MSRTLPYHLAFVLGRLKRDYRNTREQLYKYERQRFCTGELTQEQFLARLTVLEQARRLIFDRHQELTHGLDVEPLPHPWQWSQS